MHEQSKQVDHLQAKFSFAQWLNQHLKLDRHVRTSLSEQGIDSLTRMISLATSRTTPRRLVEIRGKMSRLSSRFPYANYLDDESFFLVSDRHNAVVNSVLVRLNKKSMFLHRGVWGNDEIDLFFFTNNRVKKTSILTKDGNKALCGI